ncbi:MAG TPA: winged helix-turn-helix domain-containing protein [Ktedonobacteraceae bacterium]|nr:winged helix-turn-helix domain-containing protein [Ktedonobacteraceae bacterium]
MRRDATRMIYEILSLGVRGSSKTQIIFRANLSHKLAEKYIVFLVKKGLLEIESNFGGARYLLTEKGEHVFHLLQEVERELEDFYVTSLASEMKVRGPAIRTHPSFGSERGRVPIEIQRSSSF